MNKEVSKLERKVNRQWNRWAFQSWTSIKTKDDVSDSYVLVWSPNALFTISKDISTILSILWMCGCLSVAQYPYPGRDPTTFFSITLLGVIALSLPSEFAFTFSTWKLFTAVTAYLCIASTFYTKADVISNYSLANCPGVKRCDFNSRLTWMTGFWIPVVFLLFRTRSAHGSRRNSSGCSLWLSICRHDCCSLWWVWL